MKLKSVISSLICTALLISTLPLSASASEAGKKGSFFAYLFIDSNRTDNILKPYNITSTALYSKGAKTVAKETAYYLKSMPEGRRAIDIYKVSYDIAKQKENLVWWDNGTEKTREIMLEYFEALKAEGAELDYIIDDMESDMSNWSIKSKEVADSITNDPRYLTDIKPVLEQRGFRFGTAEQGELYYVVKYSKDKYAYNIWNRAMDGDRLAAYHNRAFYDVAKLYYPDVKLSNYSSVAYNGETPISSGSGHHTYLGGPGQNYIGTHSAPVCYGTLHQLTQKGRAPEEYKFDRYHKTGYNAMRLDLMRAQSAFLSTEGRIMPWIGLKNWNSSGTYGNFFGTDYYQEFLLHTGLLNPDPFLIYNEGSDKSGDDLLLIQNILYQLDELCGFEDRKSLITKAVSWNQRYVLSGMYAGGKNVWRITPDLYAPGVTLDNFLIDKDELIFQIGNEIVDFPEGSYIYEPAEKLSDYGYWVVSPSGTYPEEFVAEGIEPALASVETDDFVPTGYMYENNSAIYNTVVHKSSDAKKEEITEDTPNKDIAGEDNLQTNIVIPSHWAKNYLESAVNAGIIVGSGGDLMPDKNISRAELITMLLRAMQLDIDKNAGPNWYDGPVALAKSMGWIENCDDGPTIINREETARIMVRAFRVGNTSRRITFTDIADVSPEMLDAVLDAASSGMINGTPDGSFMPKANVTRAEAVTMIMRCIK